MFNRTFQNILFLILIILSVVSIVLDKTENISIGLYIIISYAVLFISVWLFLSLNMIHSSIRAIYERPTDKRAEIFTNLIKKTFAVKIFLKKEELVELYKYIISLKHVNYQTKVALYDAFERKYITVPYPALPKKTGCGLKYL